MRESRIRITGIVLVILLCIPLFYLNVRHDHDWGDDFAQYINQAKNIAQGRAMQETGYVYNEHYPMLGPPAYPAGFPLLLAPVYTAWGNSVYVFNLYITAWLIVFAVLSYILFRRFLSIGYSLALVIVMVYTPWLLLYKCEINSDIPFAAFITGVILLLEKKMFKQHHLILAAILCGFAVAIRLPAIVIVPALFFAWRNKKYGIRNWLLFTVLTGTTLLIISTAFPSGEGILSNTKYYPFSDYSFNDIMHNLWLYCAMIAGHFYSAETNPYRFIAVIGGSILLVVSGLMFLKRSQTNAGLMEYFFLFYIVLLLIYPYAHPGFRFLLPVFPLMLLYTGIAIKTGVEWNIFPKYIPFIFLIVLLLMYRHEAERIRSYTEVRPGPQREDALSMFEFIGREVPENALIAFNKPRALTLYSKRRSFAVVPDADIHETIAQINTYTPEYFLVCDDLSDAALNAYLNANKAELNNVYNSGSLHLYSRIVP